MKAHIINVSRRRFVAVDCGVAVNPDILPSTSPPTGVGESATPVIGPVVASALSALTGKHYTHLPIRSA